MDNEICPLQGKSKRNLRLLLYRFFLQNLNDLQLIMFLNNASAIQEKIYKDAFIKTPESIEALEDLLEVFTRICEFKSWTMLKSAGGGKNKDPDDLPDDEEEDIPVPEKNHEEGAAETDIGNLKQAIPILDKMVSILPKFVTRVVGFDASLKDKVDVFCEAVCDNFKSFVEYAQPEKFWKKYRDGKRPKKGATEQREKLVIFEEEAEDFSL